jgi:hypothetical protein
MPFSSLVFAFFAFFAVNYATASESGPLFGVVAA